VEGSECQPGGRANPEPPCAGRRYMQQAQGAWEVGLPRLSQPCRLRAESVSAWSPVLRGGLLPPRSSCPSCLPGAAPRPRQVSARRHGMPRAARRENAVVPRRAFEFHAPSPRHACLPRAATQRFVLPAGHVRTAPAGRGPPCMLVPRREFCVLSSQIRQGGSNGAGAAGVRKRRTRQA